jgi:hypothetical protein
MTPDALDSLSDDDFAAMLRLMDEELAEARRLAREAARARA